MIHFLVCLCRRGRKFSFSRDLWMTPATMSQNEHQVWAVNPGNHYLNAVSNFFGWQWRKLGLGGGDRSMVEHLPSIHKDLDLVPSLQPQHTHLYSLSMPLSLSADYKRLFSAHAVGHQRRQMPILFKPHLLLTTSCLRHSNLWMSLRRLLIKGQVGSRLDILYLEKQDSGRYVSLS